MRGPCGGARCTHAERELSHMGPVRSDYGSGGRSAHMSHVACLVMETGGGPTSLD